MAELFKKGKKGKKNKKNQLPATSAAAAPAAPIKPWLRIGRGMPVEETDINISEITEKLEKRTAAKREKNFARADKLAMELQAQNVAYDDATHEWYIKKPKVPDNKRKRDAADTDAPTTKTKADGGGDDDDDEAPSSEDDDSEEDRLDDAFVAKMQKKLKKARRKDGDGKKTRSAK